jgi:hypothetical protein
MDGLNRIFLGYLSKDVEASTVRIGHSADIRIVGHNVGISFCGMSKSALNKPYQGVSQFYIDNPKELSDLIDKNDVSDDTINEKRRNMLTRLNQILEETKMYALIKQYNEHIVVEPHGIQIYADIFEAK